MFTNKNWCHKIPEISNFLKSLHPFLVSFSNMADTHLAGMSRKPINLSILKSRHRHPLLFSNVANTPLASISEFGVSGVKHCGKAPLRPSGTKLALWTLAPMEAWDKPSSRKLNHNSFTISALGHRSYDPNVLYFLSLCLQYFAKWYFLRILSSLVTPVHQHVRMLRCLPAVTLSTSDAFLSKHTQNYKLAYSIRVKAYQPFEPIRVAANRCANFPWPINWAAFFTVNIHL